MLDFGSADSGVMEIADAIVINKAEGDNRPKADLARRQYLNALHILQPRSPDWQVPVLLCSALKGEGIDDVWQTIESYRTTMENNGHFEQHRRNQSLDWMWSLLMDDLKDLFLRDPRVENLLPTVREAVAQGITTPGAASRRLLEAFKRH